MMRIQLPGFAIRQVLRALLLCGLLFEILSMPAVVLSAELPADAETNPKVVPPGTLFICGGGILPSHVTERFIELSGGPQARIVIVSSASYYADQDIQARLSGWYDRLAENCFQSLDILHTRSREEADDPEFSKVIESATAIWFLGGNQNWVAQTYLFTKTEERMHQLLARGGVIGGSSAGAAIMSRSMIADGNPEPMMSTGFGFLPGTVVDQHFRKRNRLERLMRALELRPGLVGIGIDEGTALIVQGRTMEVTVSYTHLTLPTTPYV